MGRDWERKKWGEEKVSREEMDWQAERNSGIGQVFT